MELEFSNFSQNFDFENLGNETPNKQIIKKCQKSNVIKVLKTKRVSVQAGHYNWHHVPGNQNFNRAINITGFLAEFGYGKYLIVSLWYASAAYQPRLVSP